MALDQGEQADLVRLIGHPHRAARYRRKRLGDMGG
jgi:hypothetical protein